MWLLASRERPHLAAECIAACDENGMSSAGVLYVDDVEAGLYAKIDLPANWTMQIAGRHAGLSAALAWGFATYPQEARYGWLADDMAPCTPRWDAKLERAAGACCMSQANDEWVAPQYPEAVRTGEPTAGQCWGGDLVRAVGWWSLPHTFQAGTDVAWQRLIERLGRMRYCEDVTVEHRHWRTGKRPQDALDTDMVDSNHHAHTQRDLRILYRWSRSPEFSRIVRRVQAKCPC